MDAPEVIEYRDVRYLVWEEYIPCIVDGLSILSPWAVPCHTLFLGLPWVKVLSGEHKASS